MPGHMEARQHEGEQAGMAEAAVLGMAGRDRPRSLEAHDNHVARVGTRGTDVAERSRRDTEALARMAALGHVEGANSGMYTETCGMRGSVDREVRVALVEGRGEGLASVLKSSSP